MADGTATAGAPGPDAAPAGGGRRRVARGGHGPGDFAAGEHCLTRAAGVTVLLEHPGGLQRPVKAWVTATKAVNRAPARHDAADAVPKLCSRLVIGSDAGYLRPVLNAVQGFNWESCKQQWWEHMAGQADFIASCGFTVVWLPPPTDSVSREGYMCGACCGPYSVPSLQSPPFASEEQSRA